jgi:hypothetical protein
MSLQLRPSIAALLLSLGCHALHAQTAALPLDDGQQHMGVASCSSAGCHGDQVYGAGAGPVVGQNEVLIWKGDGIAGAHSRAYAVLGSELGQRIARNLGMADPRQEDACLDCHANNVPESQRGRRFQISDGVSCEACHGGAENWLAYHRLGAGHEQNIERGLYPTAYPADRARLCASCHQGRGEKAQFVSHELMGAGHPRLVFELQRYTALQAHHQIDADYRVRKAVASAAQVWALGQILSAQRQVQLLSSDRAHGPAGWPEFSLYDCQACHQTLGEGMQGLDWRPHPLRRLPSGAPIAQDAALIMVRSIVAVLNPAQVADFDAALRAWHQQPAALGQERSQNALSAQLQGLLAQTLRSPPTAQRLLKELLRPEFMSLLHEQAAGEQWVLAMHSLLPPLATEQGASPGKTLATLDAQVQLPWAYSRYALSREAEPLRRWLQDAQVAQP